MQAGRTTWIASTQKPLWFYLRPLETVRHITGHLYLVRQFVIRDTIARYKGSVLGFLWMIINPLLMLGVYTFVFSVVFQARWGVLGAASTAEFAMTLFCGLVVFALFSESVVRAPLLIINNATYVKKMVFPLEILPISVVGSSLIVSAFSTLILLVGIGCLLGTFSITFFCFPLVLVPHLFFTLGLCWFLASLGVYLRDVSHGIAVIVQILFFLTPIFYPITAIPEPYRFVMRLNPLAVVIDSARRTLLWGEWPDWPWMGGVMLFSLLVAQLGYAWFMKTKRGFADVL